MADLSPARFDDGGAVLVLESDPDGAAEVCPRLLGADGGQAVDLLRIAYRDPGAAVDAWTDRAGRRPDEVGIVAVGSAAARVGSGVGGNGVSVETVEDPADLTQVGISVNEILSSWNNRATRTVACFDSITDLLGYVRVGTAFEFLHVLTRRLNAVGATAHFHLAPSVHDDRTVQQLKPLFDAFVTVDDDVEVRTR